MDDCLFCRIAAHEIPSTAVYEDDDVYAFRDIHPQAPVHILVIPKKHIGSLLELEPGDAALLGSLHMVIKKLALQEGLAARGFRVVVNTGPEAGQSVTHLHYHLLGGRGLAWPPG